MATFLRTQRRPWGWGWLVFGFLLCLIPMLAGLIRLESLASGAARTVDNARFVDQPLPVVIHILSVLIYAPGVLLQLSPWRVRWPGLHAAVGKLTLPAGYLCALSGVWMTLTYPWPELDGVVLYLVRLVVGTLMLLQLGLGTRALWCRQFPEHGRWMLRAYALGMGAGTQVFTHIPFFLLPDVQTETGRAICMTAGWILNAGLCELYLVRKRARSRDLNSVS
ncbi:DUF2306 domain-containing protein [Reinekea blandensis]|uniref:DUF2306 domain-containing protein n=1 Tax=Reinekea blandensis MED297 TaxID=314283 RepID=A4BA31_9GAMM|nr:DUF2306 domain-containing protein [Reinekea blandensis]EAR10787.1 hypothetical protein MED297_09766 [Reinekea sp. MED297] [Reinekea blandensis MED297]